MNADFVIGAEVDGDGSAEILGDFGSLGLWLDDAGAWTQMSGINPENVLAGDFDADGHDEVMADFGGLGVWLWNDGAWSQISSLDAD